MLFACWFTTSTFNLKERKKEYNIQLFVATDKRKQFTLFPVLPLETRFSLYRDRQVLVLYELSILKLTMYSNRHSASNDWSLRQVARVHDDMMLAFRFSYSPISSPKFPGTFPDDGAAVISSGRSPLRMICITQKQRTQRSNSNHLMLETIFRWLERKI